MLHCPKRCTAISEVNFNSSEQSRLTSSNSITDCLPSSLTLDLPTDLSLTDSNRTNLPLSVDDFATTAVVQHLLASNRSILTLSELAYQ